MRKRKKCRGGFTLLEIVVVILIISGLAALALPRYHKNLLVACERDAVVQLTTLHEANALYRMRAMRYLNSYTSNVNTINSALGINIIPGRFAYSYCGGSTCMGSDTYEAMASYRQGATTIFTIGMGPQSLTVDYARDGGDDSFLFPWETEAYAMMAPSARYDLNNPCCYYGSCPSLPSCYP